MCISGLEAGISGCCVLAGGLRPSPLSQAAARSALDLGVTESRTLLDALLDRLGASGATAGRPVFVLGGHSCPRPLCERPGVRVVLELDAFRGPAGAIRDAVASHALRGPVLVLEANRHYAGSFAALAGHHGSTGASVTVAATHDGRPAGAYVIESSALRHVPSRGFMDLKEQMLGRLLERGERIAVHKAPPEWTRPVRTLADLLAAARAERALHERLRPGELRLAEPPERGEPHIVDSIVMPGAVVGRGAVVTRSLLLPGARVPEGAVVVDEVRGPDAAPAEPRLLRRRAA